MNTQTVTLCSLNFNEEDPEFANECTLTEMGQYIESLKNTIRETRRKRDRKAERVFIKQLHHACTQASAFVDDDVYFEVFESFLEECEGDFAQYPKELRHALVTGRGRMVA